MRPEQDITILCVDDEANVLKALQRLLMDDDYQILTAECGEEGLAVLEREPGIQVVVSDYRMPGMDGVDFLKEVYARRPDTVRIVLSGYADTAAVVSAVNEGQIYKFVPKPWNDEELRVTIAKAVELYLLQQENVSLTKELQDTIEELRMVNDNLERMVEERTQEILFKTKALASSHFILDSLPVGCVGVDLSGLVVTFNQRAAELLRGHGDLQLGMEAEACLPEALQEMLSRLQKKGDLFQEKIELGQHKIRLTGSYMKSGEGQEGKILVLNADLALP